VVRLRHPRLTPVYDTVSHLVYAAKGADVRQVVVEGRVLLEAGRVTSLDEAAVIEEANRIRDQVRRSLATP
jgi:5-methylthioadenosine/S-adenosylhomocysteine deaminase